MTEEAEATPSKSENTNFRGLKIILSTYDGSTDPKSWLCQLETIRKAKNWSEAKLSECHCECPEPKPCPCPLNLKGLGEKQH